LTRLIAILAIVVTMPFAGMASAARLQLCDSQDIASAAAHQSAGCCGVHHQPCGTHGNTCPGTASSCAQGCGQVQTIDRAFVIFAAMEPSHQSADALIKTLISATGPDGQWRPPRTL